MFYFSRDFCNCSDAGWTYSLSNLWTTILCLLKCKDLPFLYIELQWNLNRRKKRERSETKGMWGDLNGNKSINTSIDNRIMKSKQWEECIKSQCLDVM
jgi:hypothetical protein